MLVRDLTVTGYCLSPSQSLHIFAKQALQHSVSRDTSIHMSVLHSFVFRASALANG
jgi:hypothetical protein